MTDRPVLPESGSSAAADRSPFGVPAHGRRRAVMLGVFGLLALGVVALVISVSRGDDSVAAADHGPAAEPSAGSLQSVSLTPAAATRIGVTYALVERGALAQEIRVVGRIALDETRVTTIAPKLDGWIESLAVNFTGQNVRRGDALFSLYSPMLVAAQEELLLARRLVADVANGTVEARRGADALAEAARRRLVLWDIPNDAIEQLERTGVVEKAIVLRSPAQGVVVEKSVQLGQRIMAGDALYLIADLDTVWLEGEVFERDLASVRLRQAVSAEFEALPGRTFGGRVSFLDPTLSAESRTVRVRVALANPDLVLRPGMFGTLRIQSQGSASALTIPRSALLATGTRTLVFVRAADGSLSARDVLAGPTSTDRVTILRGLSAGETVVASGTFLVDAESNLGSALGGMGSMPGMDMPAPTKTVPPGEKKEMPDMNHPMRPE